VSLDPLGESTVEEWVVVWFPPDARDRTRRFTEESKARAFAATPDIAEWNPLLDHRITTTIVVSELVPL
jgi:hypothetical protein